MTDNAPRREPTLEDLRRLSQEAMDDDRPGVDPEEMFDRLKRKFQAMADTTRAERCVRRTDKTDKTHLTSVLSVPHVGNFYHSAPNIRIAMTSRPPNHAIDILWPFCYGALHVHNG